MSKREDIMLQVSDFIEEKHLARVYSGCGLSDNKKYRYVLFSLPRNLDGEVRIYGPKFILVRYQTRYGSLPHQDNRVFTSVQDAIQFLQLAFVDFDFDKALAIPTK